MAFRSTSIANLAVIERRGDWLRVSFRRDTGWVRRRDVRAPPGREQPPTATPVLPIDGLEAAPERLERALEAMGPEARRIALGPYAAWTNVDDPALLALADAVATDAERAYRAWVGLPLVGRPRAALVLFAEAAAYHRFRRAERVGHGGRSTGHALGGIVATYVADREAGAVAATLLHEIAHLLTRRSLGPALPEWLAEGLASGLAFSRIGSDGSIDLEALGGQIDRRRSMVVRGGGVGALERLHLAVAEHRLVAPMEFLDSEWSSSTRDLAYAYAYSGLWCRFLLAEAGANSNTEVTTPRAALSRGFRSYLSGVAAGGSVELEALASAFGEASGEAEAAFSAWIAAQP